MGLLTGLRERIVAAREATEQTAAEAYRQLLSDGVPLDGSKCNQVLAAAGKSLDHLEHDLATLQAIEDARAALADVDALEVDEAAHAGSLQKELDAWKKIERQHRDRLGAIRSQSARLSQRRRRIQDAQTLLRGTINPLHAEAEAELQAERQQLEGQRVELQREINDHTERIAHLRSQPLAAERVQRFDDEILAPRQKALADVESRLDEINALQQRLRA